MLSNIDMNVFTTQILMYDNIEPTKTQQQSYKMWIHEFMTMKYVVEGVKQYMVTFKATYCKRKEKLIIVKAAIHIGWRCTNKKQKHL